jgi:hypothetical protein
MAAASILPRRYFERSFSISTAKPYTGMGLASHRQLFIAEWLLGNSEYWRNSSIIGSIITDASSKDLRSFCSSASLRFPNVHIGPMAKSISNDRSCESSACANGRCLPIGIKPRFAKYTESRLDTSCSLRLFMLWRTLGLTVGRRCTFDNVSHTPVQ